METTIVTEYYQQQPEPVVDPANAAAKYPESAPNSSPSDPEVMRRLYANMLTCRMVRERANAWLTDQAPGNWRSDLPRRSQPD